MRRSGAREFTFDIDSGIGSMLPAANQPVDFAEIQGAVKESGFELVWVEARVRGTLRATAEPQGSTQALVEVEFPRQAFLLVEGETDREHDGYGRLMAAAEGVEPQVVIRGRIHLHAEDAPGLTVLDFRIEP